jgi:hypothetical protein
MSDKYRNTSVLLLVCALVGTMVFFGCSGGSSSDPIPAKTYEISGTIKIDDDYKSLLSSSKNVRKATIVAPGVTVYLESNPSVTTTTDSNGRFSLSVPEGSHRLVAVLKSSTKEFKLRTATQTVTFSNSMVEIKDPAYLREANSFIKVKLLDTSGNPLRGGSITIWGETKTDTDGDGIVTSPLMPNNEKAELKITLSGRHTETFQHDFQAENPLVIEHTLTSTSETNRAPVVSLTANDYEVYKRSRVYLTGKASDPNGDNLSYAWSATTGTFTADVSDSLSATWEAPDTDTTATITFKASDPDGLESSAKVTIKIGAGGLANNLPEISNIFADASTTIYLSPATSYQLSSDASDKDEDQLSYSWTVNAGSLSSSTVETPDWTTPSSNQDAKVTLEVSDGEGEPVSYSKTFRVTDNPNPEENDAPIVSISSPAENSNHIPGYVNFSGSITDPEDGDLDGTEFDWTITGPGFNQTSTGKSFNYSITNSGTYTVTLAATDSEGLGNQDKVDFRINSKPVATINTPLNNEIFKKGSTVDFSGSATDVEDGTIDSSNLFWTFPYSTETGSPKSTSDLNAGTNTIKLKAQDSLNVYSDEAQVTIYIDSPPTITSIKPTSGSDYLTNDPIPFEVSINDVDEEIATASIVWTASGTTLGNGYKLNVSTLSAGNYKVEVEVTDSQGQVASDSTQVIVNPRPTMSISSPADGSYVFPDTELTFTGAGTTESGTVASSTMKWEDGYGGATSTLKTGVSTFKHTFTGNFGKHTIRLTGEDQYGNSGYAQHVIYVNATPSVTIDEPASGTRFDLGETITFKATPTDEDPTDTLSIRWLDGGTSGTELGTGEEYSTSTLASGNHNIFCEVTDQQGIKSLASISVLVNTLPTGTLSWSTTQYATAPGDIPVFLTDQNSKIISFSIDTDDEEIGGTIESYDPENIKWYNNIDGTESEIGNGNSIDASLPPGVSTITVKIYDSFYPDYTDQASATYSISVAVWWYKIWSVGDKGLMDDPVSIEGTESNSSKIHITFNNTNSPVVKEYSFDGTSNSNYQLTVDEAETLDLTATASFDLAIGSADSGKFALGSDAGTEGIYDTSNPDTAPYNFTFDGSLALNSASSICFYDDMLYVTNTGDNSIMVIDSLEQKGLSRITTGSYNIPFSNPAKIRYSNKNYGKIFVADMGNNRIERFSNPAPSTLATPITTDSPKDIAFTESFIMSLSQTNSNITLYNPQNQQELMTFGSPGTGAGQFNVPVSIFCTGKDLFILESNRLQLIRSGENDWLRP